MAQHRADRAEHDRGESGGDLTPGFYMIFVLDTAGVPSMARIARMNVAPTLPPRPPWPPEVGRVEGERYTLACGPGRVLAGLHRTSRGDGRLGTPGARCVGVDAGGRWRGAPENTAARGDGSGTAFDLACPPDLAVFGANARGDAALSALQLNCRGLAAGGPGVSGGAITPLAAVGSGGTRLAAVGSGGTPLAALERAGGFAAFGLYGHADGVVSGVGLLCRRDVDAIRVSAAAMR